MEKINIAELLKDCPKGMELDCTMFDGSVKVIFDGVDGVNKEPTIIKITAINDTNRTEYRLTKYGQWCPILYAKCVIFPKGKTTWEGFIPPCKFKDGDVITCTNSACSFVAIFKEMNTDTTFKRYVSLTLDCKQQFHTKEDWADFKIPRLATEEEKEKLFKAIEDNGYWWNPKTKTLEELIEPKFKVGDIIQDKDSYKVKIINVCMEDEMYEYESAIAKGIGGIVFDEQDDWELVPVEPKFKVGDRIKQIGNPKCFIIKNIEFDRYVLNNNQFIRFGDEHLYEVVPNKFDINTLVPFESRVLVRDDNTEKWKPNFWGFYDIDNPKIYPYECCGAIFAQCIPYEGNEHLLGTTHDCEEFFKTWKE